MDKTPLISVIVPIYKVEEYLRECVDSILKQTYTNLEIILVDDGSPDACPAICDYYTTVDPRIVVIHKKNGGLSDARNSGLNVCRGQYISFVDSDDIIHHKFIDTLVTNIEDADVILCNLQKFSFEDKLNWQDDIDNVDKVVLSREQVFKDFYKFKNGTLVVAWNKLYKREVWKELRYPVGKIHEDEFVIHKILSGLNKIAMIDSKLYAYRIREGSIIQTKTESSLISILEVYEERELFFETEGLIEQAREVYIRKRTFFLRNDVTNNFVPWKNYLILDIIRDKIPFKMKGLLILKKIFPTIYLAIRN